MIWKRVPFALGFILGLVVFLIANYYDYQRMFGTFCDDCFLTFGVPYRMYGTGGFVGVTRYFRGGIAADLFVAIVFSIGLAQIFSWMSKCFLKGIEVVRAS